MVKRITKVALRVYTFLLGFFYCSHRVRGNNQGDPEGTHDLACRVFFRFTKCMGE